MILNLSQVALSAVAAVASADVVNPALTLPYAYGVHAFGGGRCPIITMIILYLLSFQARAPPVSTA